MGPPEETQENPVVSTYTRTCIEKQRHKKRIRLKVQILKRERER